MKETLTPEFFERDSFYKFAMSTCFDLKAVLDQAVVAVRAYQKSIPVAAESTIEQLISNLLEDDVSRVSTTNSRLTKPELVGCAVLICYVHCM